MTVRDFPSLMENLLEPIRHTSILNRKVADKNTVNDYLNEISDKHKDEFCRIPFALDLTQWKNAETWNEFISVLRKRHDSKGFSFFETKSDIPIRMKYIASVYRGATELLWYNMGGVADLFRDNGVDSENESKKILGSSLNAILQKTLDQYQPRVILSFGWPALEAGTDNPWESNPAKLLETIKKIPVLKTVYDYIHSEKGEGKGVIISLKQRVENHFGLSIGRLGNAYNTFLIMEPLHHEGQSMRRLVEIEEPVCQAVEIGLMAEHFINSLQATPQDSTISTDKAVCFF